MENKYPKELLERVIKTYQPRTKTKLTIDDAGEIADNLAALMQCLDEIEISLIESGLDLYPVLEPAFDDIKHLDKPTKDKGEPGFLPHFFNDLFEIRFLKNPLKICRKRIVQCDIT
jgi:hypothetical protein